MDTLTLSAIAIALSTSRQCLLKKRKRKRSCWSKSWLLRRDQLGVCSTLLKELADEDPISYKNWMRMDEPTFYDLLRKVGPLITKQDTNMRQSIPAAQRLAVTLRHMATGNQKIMLQKYEPITKVRKYLQLMCSTDLSHS